MFAHDDDTVWRTEMDVDAHPGVGKGNFVEALTPVDAAVYLAIERLASEQRARFRVRLNEIAEVLRSLAAV